MHKISLLPCNVKNILLPEKQFYCKIHDIVYTQKVRQHIDLKTHQHRAGCPKCTIDKYRNTLSNFRIYPYWFIEDLVNEEDRQRAIKGTLLLNDIVSLNCKYHGIIQSK